jgi:hypothetical protein
MVRRHVINHLSTSVKGQIMKTHFKHITNHYIYIYILQITQLYETPCNCTPHNSALCASSSVCELLIQDVQEIRATHSRIKSLSYNGRTTDRNSVCSRRHIDRHTTMRVPQHNEEYNNCQFLPLDAFVY